MKRRPAGPLSALAMALTPLSIQVFAADTTAPFREVPRSSRYYAVPPHPSPSPAPNRAGTANQPREWYWQYPFQPGEKQQEA